MTVKEILSCPILDFIAPVSLNTGEINPYNRERIKNWKTTKEQKTAYYNGLTIKVTNNCYINLEGSLHEHYHGNNYGDYTGEEVLRSISELSSALNLNPGNTILHNLEFGVNIHLPFPVSTFLKSVYSYKGLEPEVRKYNGKGYLKKFILNQYEVKLYDKGKQRSLNIEVLRIEIKTTRMQYLHAKGLRIKTLSDLLNREYYNGLKELLLNVVSSLVIAEPKLKENIYSKNEKRLYNECKNPLYWFSLWEDNQNKYRKRLFQFRQLNEKYGELKIQTTISDLLNNKWEELTKETGTEITHPNNSQKEPSGTDITLQIVCNIPPPSIQKRYCKTCHREITDQRPGSLFCSEQRYGAEAKKCRNRDSNPRNNFQLREKRERERGLLFDTESLLIQRLTL